MQDNITPLCSGRPLHGHTCFLLIVILVALASCGHTKVDNPTYCDSLPPIFPDYAGVTVPVGIAPLNFCSDKAQAQFMDVVIKGNGGEIHIQGDGCADIPAGKWKNLLEANRGDSLIVSVSLRGNDGKWTAYKPFGIHVSTDDIDYGLVYRLIAPGYEKYGKMGIYERCLGNYDESAVMENTQVPGCINCHSFNRCNPTSMSLHVRGEHGGTLLRSEGDEAVYNTRTDSTVAACVYPYWHPTGRYIAYSSNMTHQMIHLDPGKVVEVFDDASDVHVYDIQRNVLLSPSILRRDSVWETFPAFSPDGRTLYFCAAKAEPLPDSVRCVRYDLCSIDFDPATGRFGGGIDTLVNASATGKSASMPRPSFDGRYLVYSLSDYGTFPVWHDEADLWILDLAYGTTRPLDCANSDRAESYHNWSTNSRWLVFGSRRIDGLYTRPFIVHVDADGNASKPFLLPQKNPREFYDNRFLSFNIPEFVTSPVKLDSHRAADLFLSPERTPFKGE